MKHFGVNEGLPSTECYWVIQDSKGYLWVATDAGVAKYDGYNFKTYNSSKGLPDNTVFKIHEDRYGRIWFATYSGKMAYYSYETDSIYNIKANDDIAKLSTSFPIDFGFDNYDTLYLSFPRYGYIKILPPGYSTTKKNSLTDTTYYLKSLGKNSCIYGNHIPVRWFNLKKNKNSIGHHDLESPNIPLIYLNASTSKKVRSASLISIEFHMHSIKYDDTSFLFSTGHEIVKVSKNNQEIIYNYKEDEERNHIISLYKDKDNLLWITTKGNGIYVHKDLHFDKELFHFLPGLTVSSVFQDADQGFWITTIEDGLYYIPSLKFIYLDEHSGLSSNKIISLALFDKKIYFLTADFSLSSIDIVTDKINYSEKLPFSVASLVPFDSSLLVCQTASFFLKSGNKKYCEKSTSKIDVSIKKAIDYNKDSLLGIINGGLVHINKHNAVCTLFTTDVPTIFSLYKQKNITWAGTKLGLYKYEDGKLESYINSDPLFKCRIEDMTSIGDTLFLATRGYGVIVILHNKVIHHFTESNGLASNMVKCITPGQRDDIWIGTNRGISRLKRINGTYNLTTLYISNGLISNEVNQIVEHEYKLYIATNGGLEIMNIMDFYALNSPIPIYIESFFVKNAVTPFKQRLELAYDQNFINISYKGISVKSNGKINYKYKLEGLDTSWIYTSNTFVQYTTLPTGKYKFIVYTINNDGKLSRTPAVISFCIEQPFWKTWWFIFSIICLASLITYFIIKHRIKQIKQQEKDKAEVSRRISESELKALRAQMNPHFMFNAINSIQNFVLKNDSPSAQKYLTKFARLIRSVLENSKHEQIALKKEIEALQLYMELEALRASFSFDYELMLEDSIDVDRIHIPPMIIQPYIENAILHGIMPLEDRRGKIILRFILRENILTCVIEDNGIGRKKAEEIKLKKQLAHQSMGMSITKDRMEILNQNTHNMLAHVHIYDKTQNNVALGTTVEININLNPGLND